MSMCRVFSCVVGRGCLLWLVHSLDKTLLAFTLLHFVLQGQIYLLTQVSLVGLLLHSSPLWWKEHRFGVLVLAGLVGLHRTIQLHEVAQSYPTLSDSMDCSLPGSSVPGIFQARVLEWGAIAFSNSSSGTLQIRFSLISQKMQKIIREMGFREAIKMVMWKTAHQPLTSTLDLAWARNQPIFIRLGHWVCLLQLLWLVSLDYHNKVQ